MTSPQSPATPTEGTRTPRCAECDGTLDPCKGGFWMCCDTLCDAFGELVPAPLATDADAGGERIPTATDQGWTKNDQQQEPEPSRDADVRDAYLRMWKRAQDQADELREAAKGVLREADRETAAFIRLRAAIGIGAPTTPFAVSLGAAEASAKEHRAARAAAAENRGASSGEVRRDARAILEDAAGYLRLTTARHETVWTTEGVEEVKAVIVEVEALARSSSTPIGATLPVCLECGMSYLCPRCVPDGAA